MHQTRLDGRPWARQYPDAPATTAVLYASRTAASTPGTTKAIRAKASHSAAMPQAAASGPMSFSLNLVGTIGSKVMAP